MKKAKPCDLAARLERFKEWLVIKDKPCSSIVSDVKDRAACLQDTARWNIDTSAVTFVGTPASSVRIVMYVSAVCPLCKRVYDELYDSITVGGLRGKARLGIKPFSDKPWDVALIAAWKIGRQADLMRSLAHVEERVSIAVVLKKADSIGIPASRFRKLIEDPAMKRMAGESWREGCRNGVQFTPTMFINNHRYKSYKDPQWIVDAAEYEYGKTVGKVFRRP